MHATALHPAMSHISAVIPRPASSQPTVLVADDEADVLTIMSRMLNTCGIAVVGAKDGNEAAGGSILGLMMLGAAKGDDVELIVEGDDAAGVLSDLVAMVEDGFGEE